MATRKIKTDLNTHGFMREIIKRAIQQRSKDREFHGLEREFSLAQENMIKKFDESKDLKHPRDIGNARESILKTFLATSGYLPSKYGISKSSCRVLSTSGHTSKELDIVIFDALNNISLMSREGVYDAYPIESIHGAISVKSILNKKELINGLDNIVSLKKLSTQKKQESMQLDHHEIEFNKALHTTRFGILFAYDSDLDWIETINLYKEYSQKIEKQHRTNAIVILKQGIMMHGKGNTASYGNPQIESIENEDLKMFGMPDRQGGCLYDFYVILTNLLKQVEIYDIPIPSYHRTPLIAKNHSYEFDFGAFAEVGKCPKHGDYLRNISPEKLDVIITACKNEPSINWIKALDIAYGRPGENVGQYEKQPGEVRIYNPDKLPLSDILVMEHPPESKVRTSLSFDAITTSNMHILIPYYYNVKDKLISECPKCNASVRT